MNRIKLYLSLGLCAAILAAFAPASQAQSIPIVAVGSSALFPSAAISAVKGDPVRGVNTPLCGSRLWTGSATAIDARKTLTSPNIPDESGNLWVAWDNDAAPTIICSYFSVDSIVGQRLFFGIGSSGTNATLNIPTTACTTAGGNKIAFVWDTATSCLPVPVIIALMVNTGATCTAPTNPVHFNVAFTDVRPEDAQVIGNSRVLCTDSNSSAFFPPDAKTCMGYGPGPGPGTAVLSSFSSASAQAVGYNFTGTDPISGQPIPSNTTISVGAESVIVFVNTLDSTPAGFGTLVGGGQLTNVTSHTLSALYTRNAFATRDILGGTPGALPVNFVRALQREPMSGTYTTFEWQVIRQRDGFDANSQETGILGPSQAGYTSACFVQSANAFPTVSCSNPLSFCVGSNCGLRTRVIGTGQMVSQANNAAYSPAQSILGYAFWSLGSFGNKQNIRYLTLDGVDPLFPGYTAADGGHSGVFPGGVAGQGSAALLPAPAAGQCGGYFNGDGGATITSFSCNAYNLPTFDGIQSGSYRAWNILRGVYYGATQTPSFSPLNIAGFVASAQDQAAPSNPPGTKIPDFLPTVVCANAACSSQTQILNTFRSHYSVGGVAANNGIQGGTESGGDVAGIVLNVQTELDNGLLGGTILTWIQ